MRVWRVTNDAYLHLKRLPFARAEHIAVRRGRSDGERAMPHRSWDATIANVRIAFARRVSVVADVESVHVAAAGGRM